MKKASSKDIAFSVVGLIQIQQHEKALDLLERGIAGVQSFEGWSHLARVFEALPQERLHNDPAWGQAYTAALVGLRDEKRLMEFTGNLLESCPIQLVAAALSDRTWALINQDRYHEAERLLVLVIPHLQGWRLGMAWRRLAQARFYTEGAWQEAFAQAYQHLSGRLTGLALIAESFCWHKLNQNLQVRTVLHRAVGHLEMDHYHLAWVHHALGQSYLRDAHPDAERHYLLAEQLSRKKAAKSFRSRALQGMGNLRRSQKDWLRAEAAYLEAIKTAQDTDDHRVALWSLGRCYRLSGQVGKALETLDKALRQYPQHFAPIRPEYVLCLLALGNTARAKEMLAQLDNPQGNELWLTTLAHAELAHRSGQTAKTLELMRSLDLNAFVVCEEVPHWPVLFGLLEQSSSKPTSAAATSTLLRVEALGTLRVYINERMIAIPPTGRVGELLVLLLENRGRASSETLIESLWPESTLKQKRKALQQLVRELRAALGWPDSVQSLGRAFQLDPRIRIEYDVQLARQKGLPQSQFLNGVYSPWTQDVLEELEQLLMSPGQPSLS